MGGGSSAATAAQATGDFSAAFGAAAVAVGNSSLALGRASGAWATGAVAIGYGSYTNVANTVSVGTASAPRRIINVANAVNLGQVQALIAALASSAAGGPISLSRGEASDVVGTGRAPARAAGGSNGDRGRDGSSRDPDSTSGLNDLAPSTIVAWANVNADGTLSAQRNVIQKAWHRIGVYEVVFKKQSLKNCTHTATLATSATIAVSPGTQASSLKVEVRNYRGAAMDAGFSLVVIC